MEDLPGLDAAADELYSLDPAAFIGRRDDLVKTARAAKDRALANAIKALRRPTQGARYVNLASRAKLTSLVELLKLGRELREAQAALDFKRVVALGPRRAELERRVLGDLVAHLATLGITATPPALEEVRTTLRAALADSNAAAAVESGRLDKALEYGSLGALTTALASVGMGTQDEPPDHPRPAPDDNAPAALERDAAQAEEERRRARAGIRARQERALSERALSSAREAVQRTLELLEVRRAAHQDALETVTRTREELDDAIAAHDEALAALSELEPPESASVQPRPGSAGR